MRKLPNSSNIVHFNPSSFLRSGMPTVFFVRVHMCGFWISRFIHVVKCCGTIKFEWKVAKRMISICVFVKPFIWVLGVQSIRSICNIDVRKRAQLTCTTLHNAWIGKVVWTLNIEHWMRLQTFAGKKAGSSIEKWKIIWHWGASFVRWFVCHVTTFVVFKYIISSTEVCVYLAAIHALPLSLGSIRAHWLNLCDIVCKQNAFSVCCCFSSGKTNFFELAFQHEKQLKTHFLSHWENIFFCIHTVPSLKLGQHVCVFHLLS